MWMCAIAIGGFHHQSFRIFVPFRSCMHQPAWCAGLHWNPADISGEEKLASVCCIAQEKLDHRRAKNVPCMDKLESKVCAEFSGCMKRNRAEQAHAVLGFLQCV